MARIWCTRCLRERDEAEFYRRSDADKPRRWCKDCMRSYALARVAALRGTPALGLREPEPRTGQAKRCPGCGEVKDHADFHRDAARKDGRASRCRECRSASFQRRKEA